MSQTELTALSKEICREAGTELDHDGGEKLREMFARIGDRWPSKCIAILKEKNPPLLEKLLSLESHMDSLLLIPYKPPALKKEFKSKLEEYEKTIEMAIEYANRHINLQGEH